MNSDSIPTFEHFLDLAAQDIHAVAPQTFIYAASGTRRAAALAGFPTTGDEFATWSRGELFRVVELIFDHGVQHLVMPMLGPSQFQETTGEYREYLWRWFIDGLTNIDALTHYKDKGWRVRFAFADYIDQLRTPGELLCQETSYDSPHTLWCYVVPEFQQVWEWVLDATQQTQARNYEEAIRALYGEDIPSATLYLSTGKPLISVLQLPPLLVSEVTQCYWNQRPGYSLDEYHIRQMFYDCAYLRKTWRKDKSGRAEEAMQYRHVWENAPIFGIGERMGSFWYPVSIE